MFIFSVSIAVLIICIFPDGQMLGPGSEQGDPTLSWTSFWGLFSQSPMLNVLVTLGRDASVCVWDMQMKAQIHVLSAHTGTVTDVKCQESDPQVITGSVGSTVR